MNFPSSPTVGQTYALGSKTWVWNGSAWDLQSAAPNNLTLDYVQLNTSATVTDAVGRIRWDADQGTADLGLLGGNIVQRLGQSLVAYVTNAEAVTITKGQAVYLFSATGDRASVKLAYNTGDATSAKTLGLVAEDIAAGASGFVMCQGVAYKMNTAAYTAGDFLYLGATAGALTTTKPYAPNHLVYIGTVEKTNAGNGQIYVRVQNGYELDELHNVAAQSPTTGQTIVWNGSTSLWEKNTVSLTAGVNGTLPVANGGTGQTSYTDGQLLIGNTTGNTLSKATLTAGSNITITNGNGSITIASTASGSGDVVGPASATNNGIALFDGTTGKLLKNSASQDGLIYGLTVGRGAGGVSSNTALGSGALNNASTTGGFNTALGRNTLVTLTSGEENTAVGNSVLNLATTGSNNVGVGNASLAATTTGGSNTALGLGALQRNTSASFNTAIGTQALTYNTTASHNTAVGYQAAYSNTTGERNVAIGGPASGTGSTSALYSNTTGVQNTAVGAGALKSNTTANNNVAFGFGTLYANTTGTANVAVGKDALAANTTASNSTAVGYEALLNHTTGTSNIAVGYQALYTSTTSQYNAAMGVEALRAVTSASSNVALGGFAGLNITTGNENLMLGYDSGVTGSPSGQITTQSNRICMGSGRMTNAYIQIAWTVTSDARDKTDIVDSKYGLNFVNELRPVEYKWDKRINYKNSTPNGTNKETKSQLGFLAQDVIALEKKYGAVAKDLLIADDETDELYRITETKMIPVLVKAIQELKAEFDAYKSTHP